MMRAACVLLIYLAACRGKRHVVLDAQDGSPPTLITTCEEAFELGHEGDPCDILEPDCAQDEGCCHQEVVCEIGRLVFSEDCVACTMGCASGLEECPIGTACVGDTCVPCPPSDECPPCPGDLEPVPCSDCACAPPTQCSSDEDCGPSPEASCRLGPLCYCDGPGCCVNACAGPECTTMEAPPEGCTVPCAEPGCETGLCRMQGCYCAGEAWACDTVCTDVPTDECAF